MLGDRLGKWVIFQELGRGGMGRVYRAQEEIGGRQAAIKVLAADLAQEVGFLQRFQLEIEALSVLEHPGIVRFYESGFENGIYFYAMEYVEGQSLEDILHERGRFHWHEVLDITAQICPALKHVHDHGIIHRDIKPPNLLRTNEGKIKLTDFGIAKVFATTHLTATGGVVGTAEYLSPEQAAGKPVSKKSDLYSLGIVLYKLLTGRVPFEAETFVDVLHKHRYAQFDRPRRIVPDLPYEVDELVCQLLEKDPAKRPADSMVLGRQVDRLRNRLERKDSQTSAGDHATVAENKATEFSAVELTPATIMSRLVREEVDRQMQGGFFARLLNRGWVLATLLALVLGILVWTFWPASAPSLYRDGAKLMESSRPVDWDRAFRDYFDPLDERYPDHPYRGSINQYRRIVEAARNPAPSEAKRFFQKGERLRQEGNVKEAQQVWRDLIAVFADIDADKDWVHKSEQALHDLDNKEGVKERWASVKPALQKAASLAAADRLDEAEQIWSAIVELYRADPFAADILAQVAQARKQFGKKNPGPER